MYNTIISVVVGLVCFVIFSFLVGGGDFKPLYGAFPGFVGMLAAAWFTNKRTLDAVQAISKRAQETIAPLNSGRVTGKAAQKIVDQAIGVLKEGYQYNKWQFFVDAQIDGQIGTLLYSMKKFDQSERYLRNSLKGNWVARAMLGALLYKRKKYDEMAEVFEEAAGRSKKESLLWNLYAYCMWKAGKTDAAIDVLNRALEHVPNDERTQANLDALKNKKKMKMRGWNMMWYQFHLDAPPQQRQQVNFRRR